MFEAVDEPMSEEQRVAIVTGAAGGIGRELVQGLLTKGLKVAAVDRTAQSLAELAQAAQERQHGANLMTIEADLVRDEAIGEIVAKTRSRFGVIDILVNNAGVGQATIRNDNRQRPIKFWEVTPELWSLFVAVHNNAPMALSRIEGVERSGPELGIPVKSEASRMHRRAPLSRRRPGRLPPATMPAGALDRMVASRGCAASSQQS